MCQFGVASFREFAASYGLGDVALVSDRERVLYRALGLRRGTLAQLLGWRVLVRGFQAAIMERHGVGAIQGDSTQMPGVFLIRDGRVIAAHRHETAADRPDYAAVCEINSNSERASETRPSAGRAGRVRAGCAGSSFGCCENAAAASGSAAPHDRAARLSGA